MFDKVGSDILQMKPLPGLAKCFNFVRREAQRQATMLGTKSHVDDSPMAMVAKVHILECLGPPIPLKMLTKIVFILFRAFLL